MSDVGSLEKASATEVGDLLRNRDTVPVAFTQTDLAAKGVVRLPSGAAVEMHGGPGFRLRGTEPLSGDGQAWASSTRAVAEGHHKRAAQGAEIQLHLAFLADDLLRRSPWARPLPRIPAG